MASTVPPQDDAAPIASNESDYGSDLDEATVDTLFSRSESQSADAVVVADIEQPVIVDDHGDRRPLVRLARIRDNLSAAITGLDSTCEALRPKGPKREVSIEVEYDEGNRTAFSPNRTGDEDQQKRQRERSDPVEPGKADTRSPLQRFRTVPKKPLSVTDLVTPAWCEMQYWYSLTKYGRVRRTPAMKQGSSVHKVLEEQVHVEVPVDVVTKEDRFALRIWNIIQGLRTLRRTGMTRELEVWGLLEGEVVNGIIDEITNTCPDEQMEAQMLEEAESMVQTGANKGRKRKPLASDQRTLTDYLTSSQTASILEQHGDGVGGWLGTLQEKTKTLYIVDVKTRQSKTLPAPGSQTRPTQYQLMIYHRLFSRLAANEVPAERIFQRYDISPTAMFSDTFIAQLSTLDIGFEHDADDEWAPPNAAQDSVSELLAHNNLTALWSLMITEFSRAVSPTTPSPPGSPSISALLTAEYRAAADGTLIGRRSFAFDAEQLDAYVQDEIKWWRGQRETKGVEIEEAFKCKICEFMEGCTWRQTKVEEGLQKAKLRQEKRRRSEI
ncbi:hypothetical protein LTR36_008758 [Oleoguttula mirabilis]|uniref:Exonuclease V n=1 Tax=Oleoguttula mirabilis TaxID=1507867 RepID=A0AAV9JUN0_9PEZI|nr:hypothetical protein LTR36_008758 [Oleoguttula mirabilis]